MPAQITYRTPVQTDWVDYNGHLRDAYYLLIFSYATDALMEQIGLDADARGHSGHSLFTLEAHINYLHEVKLGSEVWVQTRILGFDNKRLHLYHSLHRQTSNRHWRPASRCCCTWTWPGRVRCRSATTAGRNCRPWLRLKRHCQQIHGSVVPCSYRAKKTPTSRELSGRESERYSL